MTMPVQITGGTGCFYSGQSRDFDCAGRYATNTLTKVFSPISPKQTICEYHAGVLVKMFSAQAEEAARSGYGEENQAQTPLPGVDLSTFSDSRGTVVRVEPAPKPRRRKRAVEADSDLSL
jgi:hypothetical protein